MPSYVNPDKCDGCKAQNKTACRYICPNDLMALDKRTMKAYNQDVTMCWECYNCVIAPLVREPVRFLEKATIFRASRFCSPSSGWKKSCSRIRGRGYVFIAGNVRWAHLLYRPLAIYVATVRNDFVGRGSNSDGKGIMA